MKNVMLYDIYSLGIYINCPFVVFALPSLSVSFMHVIILQLLFFIIWVQVVDLQDLFHSGAIQSATDFQVYEEVGGLSGLDFAYTDATAIYHTKVCFLVLKILVCSPVNRMFITILVV